MPEGTVLAHVGRALAIADALQRRAGLEVCFAASGEHAGRLARTGRDVFPVHTRSRAQLLARLKKGGSAFDEAELREYVRDEVRVLGEVKPDAVVGDFRPSLGVSARHLGIPYFCVTNAVWTRYCAFKLDPPESWLPTKVLGKTLLRTVAPLIEPAVFRHYARAFNKVRRAYGLPAQEDIRDCMCSEDLTLVADAPELFPAAGLPAHFQYIGPVLWEPHEAEPEWLSELEPGRPVIYLTMGSTGPLEQIKAIGRRLLDMGLQVVCTTATETPDLLPGERDFYAVRYCPGGKLCELASVVVCHAGNGTIYQALIHGTPVVGVPEFHDQDFNMQRVEALGLGRRAAPGRKLAENVVAAVETVLADPTYAERVRAIQQALNSANAPQNAARAIAGFLGMPDVQSPAPERRPTELLVG